MKKEKSKSNITHKKVKIVGEKQFIDPTTNTVESFNVIQMEDSDFNFHKIWITNIAQAIDVVSGQKMKLLFWIIEHINYQNQLIYTYRRIAKESGIGYQTIAETMKLLVECNFMTKLQDGVYIINPDCVFKGSHNNRMSVLIQYSKTLEENKKEEVKEEPTTPTTLTPNEKLKKYLSQNQKNFEDKLNDVSVDEMLELQEKLSKMIELKLKANNANLSA